MKTVSKLIAAIIFAIIAFLALTPLGAGLGESTGMLVAAGGAFLIAVIAFIAPTGRRAWGRGFLLNGVLFIAMPLLALPLIGTAYSEVVSENAAASQVDQAATEIGAGAGAAMMFGAFSIIGLILGAIFVILGLVLVLGGRREVVIVQQSS